MKKISIKPAIWLLVFIAILPQFSETVYTPALPDIARSLNVKEAVVEYTLSIYLFGIAIGTLFWGRLSDSLGRRPCLLYGITIFILGCLGCFFSTSIEALMVSRFIQAFGGSTGSVLGQSIARDAFKGTERGKIFSLVGSAISFGPAIGPVLGGVIDETFGWAFIFLFLSIFGAAVFYLSYQNLAETRDPNLQGKSNTILGVFFSMIKDKKVMASTSLVGGVIGVLFSYYSEGAFYLINILGLSPKTYGVTFVFLALSGTTGALWAKRLHNFMTTLQIIERGLTLFMVGTSLFIGLVFLFNLFSAPPFWFISLTLISMMVLTFSGSMIAPNTLSIALTNYEHATGTASSFFGFFYYTIVSLVTFFMGSLHNGTLFPMPIYFFLIAVGTYFIFFRYLKEKR
jgi:DHA1 family bicyclomycin/chloramphenicol resistance-like MFS transporter